MKHRPLSVEPGGRFACGVLRVGQEGPVETGVVPSGCAVYTRHFPDRNEVVAHAPVYGKVGCEFQRLSEHRRVHRKVSAETTDNEIIVRQSRFELDGPSTDPHGDLFLDAPEVRDAEHQFGLVPAQGVAGVQSLVRERGERPRQLRAAAVHRDIVDPPVLLERIEDRIGDEQFRQEVRVMEDKTRQIKLLFDETSTLQDRIIKEQFVL